MSMLMDVMSFSCCPIRVFEDFCEDILKMDRDVAVSDNASPPSAVPKPMAGIQSRW